jgi:hypothetical protein
MRLTGVPPNARGPLNSSDASGHHHRRVADLDLGVRDLAVGHGHA